MRCKQISLGINAKTTEKQRFFYRFYHKIEKILRHFHAKNEKNNAFLLNLGSRNYTDNSILHYFGTNSHLCSFLAFKIFQHTYY